MIPPPETDNRYIWWYQELFPQIVVVFLAGAYFVAAGIWGQKSFKHDSRKLYKGTC
jgi:hypothetical protein